MDFNFSNFDKYRNSKFLKQASKEKFETIFIENNQLVLQELHSLEHPSEKSALQKKYNLGPTFILQNLIIDEFLQPIIKELEENPDEVQKQGNEAELEKLIKDLKLELLKLKNQLQAQRANNQVPFAELKSTIRGKVAINQNSFEYQTSLELQNLCSEICDILISKNTNIKFQVTPPYSQYNNTSPKDRDEEIIKSILSSAAKKGIDPSQVTILINNIEQKITADTIETYSKTASEALSSRLGRPRI